MPKPSKEEEQSVEKPRVGSSAFGKAARKRAMLDQHAAERVEDSRRA